MLLRLGHIFDCILKYSHDTRCYGEDILFDCILKYSHDTCCYGEDILFDCIQNTHMTHVATARTYLFGIKYSHDTRCYGEDILFDCMLKYSHDTRCYGEDIFVWYQILTRHMLLR